MICVKDIYDYIDSFAPFNTAEDFDNVGILVGDPNSKVTKAVVSLDITKEVVQEAALMGAEVIISHHPVIFSPLKRVMHNSVVGMMIKNNISAVCAHTNLDKSTSFGVNTALGEGMRLTDVKSCEGNEILFTGHTEKELTAEEFARIIKTNLDCESISYTQTNNKIKKVGLCSGAGGSEIFSAIGCGCDAFVTGEIKHHEIIAANENGISLFIPGHYKSEDIVIKPLCEKLSKQFEGVSFVKSGVFTDKIKFM